MRARAIAARSYLATRWASRRWRSCASFERWQQRQVAHWLRHDVPKVDFYKSGAATLADLPVTDKAVLMSAFERFNIAGIDAETARAACDGAWRRDGLTFGMSTGTSGNRGLFVISDAERYRWLGAIVAKALPDIWRRRERVAVILPQNTALYESTQISDRIALRFYSSIQSPDAWRDDIERFEPTTIVGQPSILRYLANQDFAVWPERLFSAAETLDPPDRSAIEQHFGFGLGQIYMATEGLLGVTCRHGTLHLAEDSVHFEMEDAGGGLVSPLISCFRRKTQIMARYRMNDLLRLSPEPCRCGSPLMAVDEVCGRADDVFRFAGPREPILVTPDAIRNTVLDADMSIDDFRVWQTAPEKVELWLTQAPGEDAAKRACAALQTLFDRRGASAGVYLRRGVSLPATGRKLRRVERRYREDDE